MSAPTAVPLVEVIVDDNDAQDPRLLRQLLERALDCRPRRLIVNVAACRSLDAGAIWMILEVHRLVRRGGGTLTLRNPSARLRRNLHLTQADLVLDIHPRTAGRGPAHTT